MDKGAPCASCPAPFAAGKRCGHADGRCLPTRIRDKEAKQMNQEKQTLSESEQKIKTNIFNLEELSRRTAIKAEIEKAKISFRIAQNAIESQDPKTLLRGQVSYPIPPTWFLWHLGTVGVQRRYPHSSTRQTKNALMPNAPRSDKPIVKSSVPENWSYSLWRQKNPHCSRC